MAQLRVLPHDGAARFTRRRVGALAGGAAGVVSLAACGGQPATSSAPVDTKSKAPVTLRSWILQPGNPEPNDATDAAFAAIKEKYPYITVADEGKGAANQAYVDAVVTASVSGTLPDLLYAQGPQIQGFIRNGVVRQLDDLIAKTKDFDLKDFPDSGLKIYQSKGKQFAIPYDHGPHVLWYNKSLFDKEGVKPPDASWTMNDLVEAARKLTKPAGSGMQWGASLNVGSGYTLQATWLGPWGGKFLNEEETETYIDGKEAIDALEFWYDFRAKRHYSAMPGETANWWDGNIGMKNTGPWDYRAHLANKPNFQSDIADWPKGPAGKRGVSSMGSGYPIGSQSKYPDDAWLWLSEYLGKDDNRSVLGQFVKTGKGTPARYSLLAKWEKSPYAPPNAKIIAPILRDYAVVGHPISPVQNDINKVVSDAFNAVWAGQLSMTAAAKQIKDQLPPILDQNKGK